MEDIKESGQAMLSKNADGKKIFLMTIIGEIEGHELVGSSSKATKYEHIIQWEGMWRQDLPLRR